LTQSNDDSRDATLDALQPRLQRFFVARITDATARADLVGRVNERVLRRLRAGDPIDDVERFVFGVAKHVLQEHWREQKRARVAEVTLSPTVENLGRELSTTVETGLHSRKSLLRALSACLEAQSDTDRLIAERCYGEGKSKENRAALAEELGMSRNTLDARISRLRVKLEQCVRARLTSGPGGNSTPSP
jgi:RNA polymerase sigma factor (sigma-70 family)